jgi:hypothetical protein
MYNKIITLLKNKGQPLTQAEIASSLRSLNINRAILLGYLRCLSDLGKIKSKDSGKAKIYFL